MTADAVWSWLLAASGLGPLAAAIGYAAGLALHAAGRSTRPATAAIALGLGVFLGMQIATAVGTLQAVPGVRSTLDAVLPLGAGLVLALVLGASGRRWIAGPFLIGLAVPWTALFAAYAIDLARGADLAPLTTVVGLLVGLVPLGLGLALTILPQPPPVADPAAAPGRPGSRQPGSLTAGLFRLARYGAVGPSVVLPTVAAVIVPLFGRALPVLVQVVLVALIVVAASELELRAVPRPVRRALEAFHWTGRHAIALLEERTGRPMPRSRGAMAAWLTQPETDADRAFRPELLTFLGRYGEAAEIVARLPIDTPFERYQRAKHEWELAWRLRLDPPPVDITALARDIGPAGDPLRGVAAGEDAWRRSEIALARLEPDWIEPLVTFRDHLGHEADGLHARAMRGQTVLVAAIPAAVLFLLGWTGAAPG